MQALGDHVRCLALVEIDVIEQGCQVRAVFRWYLARPHRVRQRLWRQTGSVTCACRAGSCSQRAVFCCIRDGFRKRGRNPLFLLGIENKGSVPFSPLL